MDWKNKIILVTGGTGSFGKEFIEIMLKEYSPAKLIVFSRDEQKQHEMRQTGFLHENLRYFIGDVRDYDRLRRAFDGVDYVIHAAALKQVPACEYNPMEAVKTNILGSSNVIDAALDTKVDRVISLSTDKAVNPVNLYGATKLAAEKLFVQSNAYAGGKKTRFSCVRYGNVVGSRGSVVPLFIRQRKKGVVTVTDERMTRFWAEIRYIGIRPGEKLHEVLISEDEARTVVELDDMYVVQPSEAFWFGHEWESIGKTLPDDFKYVSNKNGDWLTVEQIQEIIKPIEEVFK